MQYWQAQFNYFNYAFVVVWCNRLEGDQHVSFICPQHKITITQHTLVLSSSSTNMQVSFHPWHFANLLNLFFSFFPLAKHNVKFLIAKHIYVMWFFMFSWIFTISIITCLYECMSIVLILLGCKYVNIKILYTKLLLPHVFLLVSFSVP